MEISMKDSVKNELIAIVGSDRACTEPEDLVAYSYDPHVRENLPDIVLFPTTTEEVSAIMKTAYREEIPVTPRGSGTNLAGETVPVEAGIVLAMGRMDQILEIDPRNRIARVQRGSSISIFSRKSVSIISCIRPIPAPGR
jgi:glycolate oxidase